VRLERRIVAVPGVIGDAAALRRVLWLLLRAPGAAERTPQPPATDPLAGAPVPS